MSAMTRCRWRWKWVVLASWLAIGGAASSGEYALAQSNIVPDTTLGSENSRVTSTGAVDRINGGATRGANLFHSFQEFNVDNGRSALFTNPPGIENILSRVTGTNPSNILGTLGVTGGNANLFLINPNGIIFGPNARLNVGGSFVATTANGIRLANGDIFSANPVEPLPTQLLNVNPNALLFNQIAAQGKAIVNRSQAGNTGLKVEEGKSLLLVGGDVFLEGGWLQALGGRVELAGVAQAATVGLNVSDNNFSLNFPANVARASVSLTDSADVNVASSGGGSIAVNARQIDVLGGSSLRAGISLTSQADGAQAGDITLNATGTLNIENSSIYNIVFGAGNGGDLRIDTGKLFLQDGIVATATVSQGSAGDLIVKATDSVELTSSDASNGSVKTKISFTIPNSSLNQDLEVADEVALPIGLFSASINAQSILNAQNILILPRIFNVDVSLPTAGGNAGNLTIETGRLIVSDGAVVSPGTTTAGNAGDLSVKADLIELSGTSANNAPSGFEFLTIADRVPSGLRNGTVGSGSGGNSTIETGQLIVRDGAWVGTSTSGISPAGVLIVNAKESVELSGTAANGFPSLLASATRGAGDANRLTINTKRLIVSDGAIISAATAGKGQGGELTINASESVELIGTSTKRLSASVLQRVLGVPAAVVFGEGPVPSGVITGTLGEGDANNLTINTGRLSIQGGAQASVSTVGAGNAGSLTVRASSIELAGTSVDRPDPNDIVGRSLLTTAVGSGSTRKAGGIDITTGTLSVDRGAAISVSNAGSEDAGSLKITANSIKLDTQGRLAATTASRNGGNITLDVRDYVLMRNNSTISTTAAIFGSGGNITINSPFIIAVPSENSDIVANADRGSGGRIIINATGIYGLEKRDRLTSKSDINASSNVEGLSGVVELNTPDIDPNSGLVNLPSVPVDTEVAQGCYAGGTQAQSEFIITGRGGLPPNPGESLSTDAVQVDLVTLNPEVEQRSTTAVSTISSSPSSPPIVEATGWVIDKDGNVVLTANAHSVTPHSSRQRTVNCGAS